MGHMQGQSHGHGHQQHMGHQPQMGRGGMPKPQQRMANDDDFDGSDADNKPPGKLGQGLGMAKKKIGVKDDRRVALDEAKGEGSENDDSQGRGQGQQFYEFQGGYGNHPPAPYNYQGYNYQMPAHGMAGGQAGYGMYQGYPGMNPRAPVKPQYPYSAPGYSYSDRPYSMMGGKAPAPQTDYYDEYAYDGDMNQRAGHMEPQHGYPMNKAGNDYLRQDKRPKPQMPDRAAGGYPYQYGGQSMGAGGQMYQTAHQGGQFEVRGGPYDYNNYKQPKSEETGMQAGLGNPYNYSKNTPAYSYGQYSRNTEKAPMDFQENDNEVSIGQGFREDPPAKGQKKPQPTKPLQRPQPGDDGKAKVGKANPKQFAEDMDKRKDN